MTATRKPTTAERLAALEDAVFNGKGKITTEGIRVVDYLADPDLTDSGIFMDVTSEGPTLSMWARGELVADFGYYDAERPGASKPGTRQPGPYLDLHHLDDLLADSVVPRFAVGGNGVVRPRGLVVDAEAGTTTVTAGSLYVKGKGEAAPASVELAVFGDDNTAEAMATFFHEGNAVLQVGSSGATALVDDHRGDITSPFVPAGGSDTEANALLIRMARLEREVERYRHLLMFLGAHIESAASRFDGDGFPVPA